MTVRTRGPIRSPEEIIEKALETLAQKESVPFRRGPSPKSPAEAVADILEIQKRNRQGGLKIKDDSRRALILMAAFVT